MKKKNVQLRIGIIWNMGSLLIIGLSGIVFNILISLYYDASVLGVFNQAFALYIFFSQLAVFGLHLSLFKHISEIEIKQEISEHLLFCLLAVVVTSSISTMLLAGLAKQFATFLNSTRLSMSIYCILPGLFCFALNKVLLLYLNGIKHLRAYSVFNSLRYIIIMFILFMAQMSFSGDLLTLSFSVAEGVLLFVLLIYVVPHFIGINFRRLIKLLPIHLNFGFKALPAGFLMELNTRVDVLMLGYFLSDRQVGIYTFASVFAEGFYQFLIVIRTNINPYLLEALHEHSRGGFVGRIKVWRKNTYIAATLLGGVGCLFYPGVLRVMGKSVEYGESYLVFCFLIGGIVLASGYVPFNQILLLVGKPGFYTLSTMVIVLVNVFLNMILIPIYGLIGAGIATGISLSLTIFVVQWSFRNLILLPVAKV